MRNQIFRATQIVSGVIFKIINAINELTFSFLFFRITPKGVENLKGLKGPLIITPNHRSVFDHWLVISVMPVSTHILPVRAIAKDRFYTFRGLGGIICRTGLATLGALRLHRGKAIFKVVEILKKNGVIVIYPEGGKNYKPGVGSVKKGVGVILQKIRVPILPIGISLDGFTLKSFFFGRKVIKIRFGKPFYPKSDNLEEVLEEIRARIAELVT